MNEWHQFIANLEEQLTQEILAVSERRDKKLELDERAAEIVDEILKAVITRLETVLLNRQADH